MNTDNLRAALDAMRDEVFPGMTQAQIDAQLDSEEN